MCVGRGEGGGVFCPEACTWHPPCTPAPHTPSSLLLFGLSSSSAAPCLRPQSGRALPGPPSLLPPRPHTHSEGGGGATMEAARMGGTVREGIESVKEKPQAHRRLHRRTHHDACVAARPVCAWGEGQCNGGEEECAGPLTPPSSHRLGVPLERVHLLRAEAFPPQTRVEGCYFGLALVHVPEERALITGAALLRAGAADLAAGCLGRLPLVQLLRGRHTTNRGCAVSHDGCPLYGVGCV